jgi:hypothetical protein
MVSTQPPKPILDTCVSGSTKCTSGRFWSLCDHNAWFSLACAPGTSCFDRNNAAVCDYAAPASDSEPQPQPDTGSGTDGSGAMTAFIVQSESLNSETPYCQCRESDGFPKARSLAYAVKDCPGDLEGVVMQSCALLPNEKCRWTKSKSFCQRN